jgi:hypothetical protein
MNAKHHNNTRRAAARAAVVLSLAALSLAGVAATRGTTELGAAFLEGGIGQPEIEAMQSETGKYSLWVITAARHSGAYLADVRLDIVDANGKLVMKRRMEGPWLLVDLPLGRYEVRAEVDGQVQSRTTTIHPGDHHQIVFYFTTEGEVLPRTGAR